MPILNNFTQFDGIHWETGTVRNALDYQGIVAPHNGKPYSEALLMGISGGAVMGYFSFAYGGHDPQARILTRNTFSPWDTLLSRLGVIQNVMHTTKPEKGVQNLIDTLNDGLPAIVWADLFTLPYNTLPWGDDVWAMFPILVYGYDEDNGIVHVSDRAKVPLTVETTVLAKARARVKKDKFRIITLDLPNHDKVSAAVQAGIWDCINLYTEKPPKGSKNNFGLAAYHHWVKLLTKPKTRMSWEKEFPAGRKMYAGLVSQYVDINIFGKNGRAERDTYGAFLEEAATLLQKPDLSKVAQTFRQSAAAWQDLSQQLLPDDVPMLKETRNLLDKRYQLFLNEGNDSLEKRQQITQRLDEIKAEMAADFPLNDGEVVQLRQAIADQVMIIHDIEATAVEQLKHAIS